MRDAYYIVFLAVAPDTQLRQLFELVTKMLVSMKRLVKMAEPTRAAIAADATQATLKFLTALKVDASSEAALQVMVRTQRQLILELVKLAQSLPPRHGRARNAAADVDDATRSQTSDSSDSEEVALDFKTYVTNFLTQLSTEELNKVHIPTLALVNAPSWSLQIYFLFCTLSVHIPGGGRPPSQASSIVPRMDARELIAAVFELRGRRQGGLGCNDRAGVPKGVFHGKGQEGTSAGDGVVAGQSPCRVHYLIGVRGDELPGGASNGGP